jgi:hypothetical protein
VAGAGVTGAAVTAAILATAPAVAALPAAAPSLVYRTFNVPGSIATELIGINDSGVLTGDYVAKNNEHVLAGFIDARGHITSFTYPSPASYTHSIGINNAGAAVGFSQNRHTHLYQGWLRSPAGHFTPLNDPAAGTGANQGTQADTINDHGVVVGVYITSTGAVHGFRYQSGQYATITVPHAYYGKPGYGVGIACNNNAGAMVGWVTPTASNVVEGLVDTAGNVTTFTGPGAGTRPGDATFANAISNTGAIVGTSNGPSGASHGWVLSGTRFTTLADPHATGAFGTAPEGINRHGVVAGVYLDTHGLPHGFLVNTGITGAASPVPARSAASGPTPASGTTGMAPVYRTALPARYGPLAEHTGTTP